MPKKSSKAKKKPAISKKRKIVKNKKKVLAVPKGYHSVIPYLIVNGAANAIEFYKKVFGAKVVMRMDLPNGKISHAELKIGDSKIMLGDQCPERGAYAPANYGGSPVGIHLYIKNVDEVVKRAVRAGAKLIRPVENMFYGDRSAAIKDPFDHQWYVSTHVEDVSIAQVKKRAAALFGNK